MGEVEERDSVYIPVSSFCTSYARKLIIETMMGIRKWSLEKYGEDYAIYSDTDSAHFISPNPEEDMKELANFIKLDEYKENGSDKNVILNKMKMVLYIQLLPDFQRNYLML